MKILLLGASGKVGRTLTRQLKDHDLLTPMRADFDLCEFLEVRRLTQSLRPDVIINAAAHTNIESCEVNQENAYNVNTLGPINLAMAATDVGALLLHLSTDYVFEGHGATCNTYFEYSVPLAKSHYGRTKLEGENGIQSLSRNYVILRLSTLYDETLSGPLDPILQAKAGKGTIPNSIGVLSQYCCPTSTTLVARAVAAVVEDYERSLQRQEFSYPAHGLYHVSTSEPVWRETFVREALSNIFPTHDDWRFTKYRTRYSRPTYSVMKVRKFQERFRFDLPSWRMDLQEMIPAICERMGGKVASLS